MADSASNDRTAVAPTIDRGAGGDDGPAESSPTVDPAITPTERVEQRLQVTSPRMWLALIGFVVLIAAGVVWGVLGRAADQVAGVGIILPSEGLFDVAAPDSGTVQGVPVRTGDQVTEGQLLVSLLHLDGTSVEVQSAIDGTVVSLLVKRGSFVTAGAPVAIIEPLDSDLLAVLYVGASDGKQVEPGMRAFIAPSTTQASQYGSMVGTVAEVSSLTVGAEQLSVTLGRNSPLIEALLARGPALEVIVVPETADTVSGFAWTASDGPDFPITSGTLVDGSVVIAEGSPFDQILGR
jgi:biotin carboxyl carrier protein